MNHSPQAMAALAAIERGWAVFPCKRDKAPLTEHGFNDATTSRGQVLRWWHKWPDANIGIATGPSQLVVIDEDPRHGGSQELLALCQIHGPLPETLTVRSGGGGWHYYFHMPLGLSIPSGDAKLGPGLDIKAEKGCITGAGSVHLSGQTYVVEKDCPIAQLPSWVLKIITRQHQKTSAPGTNGNGAHITEGTRNATLTSLAGSMRRRGMSQEAMLQALLTENSTRCDPPLPEEEVRRIAFSIARYAPEPERPPGKTPEVSLLPYHLTELGNAERLFARFGDKIHWIQDWKKWATWTPPRWDTDGGLTVTRFAKHTLRALYREAGTISQQAAGTENDTARQEQAGVAAAALKHALQSESDKKINAMISLLKEMVAISPRQFDADPWLLNCHNGAVHLLTGKLVPHVKEQYLTKLVPLDFDPDASCHQWEDFLDVVFAGNQELISWIQKAIGYTLTGSIQEQVFFLCHGVGSNGKSTFLQQLAAISGEYGTTTAFQTFVPQRSETIRNDLAALRGCRFVSAIESMAGGRLSENILKSVTGGDKITARFLHGEFFSFDPQFKVWLASNHRPIIKDTTHAMWRRVCLIPFSVVISDDDQDHLLGAKLKAEWPGILAWAVRGCVRWQKEGLKPFPEIVTTATEEYREESDIITEFLTEECILQKDFTTPSSLLYSAFCRWSETQGEKKPMSINAFGASLTEKGFTIERSSLTRRKVRRGVGLRVQPEQEG